VSWIKLPDVGLNENVRFQTSDALQIYSQEIFDKTFAKMSKFCQNAKRIYTKTKASQQSLKKRIKFERLAFPILLGNMQNYVKN
jgi:hypothetical protein